AAKEPGTGAQGDAAKDDAAKEKDKPASKPGEAAGDAGKAQGGAGDKDKKKDEPEPFDYEKAIRPDKEPPARTPGAILGVAPDGDHFLAFGMPPVVSVVSESSDIFTPLKLDRGTNVGVYEPADRLLRSGFTWEESKKQLAQKAWLVHQPRGKGHIVAFAEDPNLRAFVDGLNLAFLNAVLLAKGRWETER